VQKWSVWRWVRAFWWTRCKCCVFYADPCDCPVCKSHDEGVVVVRADASRDPGPRSAAVVRHRETWHSAGWSCGHQSRSPSRCLFPTAGQAESFCQCMCTLPDYFNQLLVAAVCNRAGHYIFALWFLSIFFFLFFLALSQRPQVGCLPYFDTWYGPSANLERRSERCCTRLAANAGPKKVAKNRHLGTIPQLCWAIFSQLRHVSTIGKKTC